ncbi:MAG TPA: DUF3488 and transglutaminase-like domain-containing protein [Segeticoccus sp.]|nr:DUF3488 and transglutaminase-like domain-containing protein [Segeticoccus sp.]
MRGRPVEGLLAAAATVVSAWPVTTLLQGHAWFGRGLLLVLVVAGTGMLARAARVPGWLVVVGQVVLVVLVTAWLFTTGQLWHGLPGPESFDRAVALVTEAIRSMNRYAAPAPATPGLVFITVGLFGLVAVAVDYLAVTRRTPAVAGLPLLVAFLVSASNSGAALNPVYFLAIAAVWLLLLARQGSAYLRRWGTGAASPSTPVPTVGDTTGVSAYASLARSLGVVVLVAAVVLPAVLPHLPPTYLAQGLGRNPNAQGHGNGTVGFNETLDLKASLTSRDHTPVLRYRTKDPAPPPLRVSVTADYDASSGRWLPRGSDGGGSEEAEEGRHPTPSAIGLSSDVPRDRWSMTVVANGLRAPQVATPFPLLRGDFDGVGWWVTSDSQVTRAVEQPERYAVTYLELSPQGTLPKEIREATNTGPLPRGASEQDLQLPERSAQKIREVAARVTRDQQTVLQKAVAIQDWLRDPLRFTYSLKLAPPVRGQDGETLDPIRHFLRTKRGYCVQFATAMIMMSRAEGIPARMAVGFLPGDYSTGTDLWNITQADAHAWPELYLPGLGWTRFEPTPSVRSGLPPMYAIDLGTGSTGSVGGAAQGGRQDGAPAPLPPQRRPDLPGALSPGTTAAPAQSPWPWFVAAGLLAALALGSAVVPLAARRRRRAARAQAGGPRERVEAQWEGFLSRLDDLGVDRPVGRTPRQLHAHYVRQLGLVPPAADALGRVLAVVERSRYAPPGDDVDADIRPDLRVVLRDAESRLGWRTRLIAALWPVTGRRAVREAVGGWRRAVPDAASGLGDRLRGRSRRASGSTAP